METVNTIAEALLWFAMNNQGTVLCVYRDNKKDETSCVCDSPDQAERFYSSVLIETEEQERARRFNEYHGTE